MAENPWLIKPFAASQGLDPEQFIALRGLNPSRYSALFHSAAAAEFTQETEQSSAHHSAAWSLLLITTPEAPQLDLLGLPSVEKPAFLPRLQHLVDGAASLALPKCPASGQMLPFAGGWQLYLGYELAAEVEPVLMPQLVADDQQVTAQAKRVYGALLFHHQSQKSWLCLEQTQAELADAVLSDIAQLRPQLPEQAIPLAYIQEQEPSDYLAAIHKAQRYIRDGDVFQANLSRAWQLGLAETTTSEAIYRRLSAHNPAPFSAWMSIFAGQQGHAFELISSSPERLVAIEKNASDDSADEVWVSTRPIAGTRARMPELEKNQRYLNELQQSPKENAEHLMLIDLERNDLGRVCQPGSIEVDELMRIESYAHVHHIVSNVRGKKRDDASIADVIAAVFPGGTITGCPKVRCMEIIAELEVCNRGAYTGAVGYLGLDGRLDLNIVIRSLVRHVDQPQQLSLRAGAGIVIDSNPEHELQETRAKANSVLRAFGAPAAV